LRKCGSLYVALICQHQAERLWHAGGWAVRARANPLSLGVWPFTLRFVLPRSWVGYPSRRPKGCGMQSPSGPKVYPKSCSRPLDPKSTHKIKQRTTQVGILSASLAALPWQADDAHDVQGAASDLVVGHGVQRAPATDPASGLAQTQAVSTTGCDKHHPWQCRLWCGAFLCIHSKVGTSQYHLSLPLPLSIYWLA
jgi:hypothetical protein